MKKRMVFLLILFPVVLHLFALFFLHFDENISPKDFEHGFKKDYVIEVSQLDFSLLDPILNQPFHYLGHGKQMVAFESLDGKFVLKFFNPMRPLKNAWYKHLKYWKRYSSLNWISREWFRKNSRLKKLFKQHQMAYELLRRETGLVFVHLSPSQQVCHFVHVTDNRGKTHIFDLGKTPFVLQKKAVLVPDYLFSLLRENRQTEAGIAVAKLVALLEKRIEKGITDRIQTMENNYGFVDGEPIQIDVGKIRFDPTLKLMPRQERERILSNFHHWLSQKFPELEP